MWSGHWPLQSMSSNIVVEFGLTHFSLGENPFPSFSGSDLWISTSKHFSFVSEISLRVLRLRWFASLLRVQAEVNSTHDICCTIHELCLRSRMEVRNLSLDLTNSILLTFWQGTVVMLFELRLDLHSLANDWHRFELCAYENAIKDLIFANRLIVGPYVIADPILCHLVPRLWSLSAQSTLYSTSVRYEVRGQRSLTSRSKLIDKLAVQHLWRPVIDFMLALLRYKAGNSWCLSGVNHFVRHSLLFPFRINKCSFEYWKILCCESCFYFLVFLSSFPLLF